MVTTLTTEDGNLLIAESVAGITGATQFNDTQVTTINKETFDTDPLARAWLYGSGWAHNGTNDNMEDV